MSSGLWSIDLLPRRVRPHHGVQNRKQLAHTGDESDFLWLAGRDESTIEGANDWVPSGRDKGAHIEHGADGRAATPDDSLPTERATITGERRHAHERRDLLAIELAEFGEVSQQRAAHDGTDPGCGAEQILFHSPDRALLDGGIEVTINGRDTTLEPADMAGDLSTDGRHGMRQSGSL